MGNLCWLLGIGIDRDCKNRTISFSQAAYVQKIVECFSMEDANPLSIPIAPGHNLTKSQSPANESDTEDMRNIPYWEAVGSLMYAVIATWPDIAYAVSYLARFMLNPGHAHWEAVKKVIRYLKGTKDVKLILGRGEPSPGRRLIGRVDQESRDTATPTETHRNTGMPSPAMHSA